MLGSSEMRLNRKEGLDGRYSFKIGLKSFDGWGRKQGAIDGFGGRGHYMVRAALVKDPSHTGIQLMREVSGETREEETVPEVETLWV